MKKIVTVILMALVLAIPLALAQDSKIHEYIVEKSKTQDTVRVSVFLKGDKTEFLERKQFDSLVSKVDKNKVFKTDYPEAFTADLTLDEMKAIAKNKEVDYIVPYIPLKPLLQDTVSLIDAVEAWDKEVNEVPLTGQGQTICVVDTGVNFNHVDLADKNIMGGNLDCYADINCPVNATEIPSNNHGTHVAGIAAAEGGINGIAKGSNIISAKVFPNGDNTADPLHMKRAVNWCSAYATEYNISVITISIGSDETFEGLCDDLYPSLSGAINAAAGVFNIPVVISTGNSGSTEGLSFPSCMSNVIRAASSTKNDTVSTSSNYNELVKLFAPGQSINSTCFPLEYCIKSGTSMSAPHIAGSISIMKQALKQQGLSFYTPSMIENALFNSGEPITDLPFESWRRINVDNALSEIDFILPSAALYTEVNNAIISKNGNKVFVCNGLDWELDEITFTLNSNNEVIYSETREIQGSEAEEKFVFTIEKEPQFSLIEEGEDLQSPVLTPGNYAASCSVKDASVLSLTSNSNAIEFSI